MRFHWAKKKKNCFYIIPKIARKKCRSFLTYCFLIEIRTVSVPLRNTRRIWQGGGNVCGVLLRRDGRRERLVAGGVVVNRLPKPAGYRRPRVLSFREYICVNGYRGGISYHRHDNLCVKIKTKKCDELFTQKTTATRRARQTTGSVSPIKTAKKNRKEKEGHPVLYQQPRFPILK